MSTGWIDPRVGSGQNFCKLRRVGSKVLEKGPQLFIRKLTQENNWVTTKQNKMLSYRRETALQGAL